MSMCYDKIVGYDTANKPITERRCFCGTTGCLEKNKIPYNPDVFDTREKEDEGIITEEDEQEFYDTVFKN